MHEHAIAAKIVAIVEEEIASRETLAQEALTKVKRVVVEAGRMHAIVPESLQFHFDVIKKAIPRLALAELVVHCREIVVECEACHRTIQLEDAVFVCANCNGPVKVLSGDELLVESISLE